MKRNILFAILFSLSISLFAREHKIVAVETENNVVTECYNESVSTVRTKDNIEISLSLSLTTENEIRVCVDIKNLGDSSYRFDERDIRAYFGNHETDMWKESEYVPPTAYYERAEAKAEFNEAMALVGLGIALIDGGFTPPLLYGYRPHSRHGHYTRHYTIEPIPQERHADPAFVGLGIANLILAFEEGETTLDYLRDHLLYDAEIEPNEGYSGIFFIPADKGPDYKISIRIGKGEVVDFTFERSDRERILHPWADTSDTKVAFTFFPGVQYNNGFIPTGGMNCSWLTKGVGGYFGFSLGEGRVFSYDREKLVEFGGGITTKLCPHVWLTGGLSAEYIQCIENKKLIKEIWTAGPDLGMNFNWGWVDLSFETKYRLFNVWEASLGFGFAL